MYGRTFRAGGRGSRRGGSGQAWVAAGRLRPAARPAARRLRGWLRPGSVPVAAWLRAGCVPAAAWSRPGSPRQLTSRRLGDQPLVGAPPGVSRPRSGISTSRACDRPDRSAHRVDHPATARPLALHGGPAPVVPATHASWRLGDQPLLGTPPGVSRPRSGISTSRACGRPRPPGPVGAQGRPPGHPSSAIAARRAGPCRPGNPRQLASRRSTACRDPARRVAPKKR